MFYLFDKDGNTATFCPDYDRLFDMFATETDGAKVLPEGYVIKEYEGYLAPGQLYLDDAGDVKERVYEVDEEAEAARAKALALKELDTQYAADKSELSSQYLDAAMSGDTDTMTAIKQELAALNAKYDADYKTLSE